MVLLIFSYYYYSAFWIRTQPNLNFLKLPHFIIKTLTLHLSHIQSATSFCYLSPTAPNLNFSFSECIILPCRHFFLNLQKKYSGGLHLRSDSCNRQKELSWFPADPSQNIESWLSHSIRKINWMKLLWETNHCILLLFIEILLGWVRILIVLTRQREGWGRVIQELRFPNWTNGPWFRRLWLWTNKVNKTMPFPSFFSRWEIKLRYWNLDHRYLLG